MSLPLFLLIIVISSLIVAFIIIVTIISFEFSNKENKKNNNEANEFRKFNEYGNYADSSYINLKQISRGNEGEYFVNSSISKILRNHEYLLINLFNFIQKELDEIRYYNFIFFFKVI